VRKEKLHLTRMGDALSIHLEFGFQLVFTVVISVAACVAGRRYIRGISRRGVGGQRSKQHENDAP
jgi:membrane protein implicated in regulation of membrane protease activity